MKLRDSGRAGEDEGEQMGEAPDQRGREGKKGKAASLVEELGNQREP